MRNGDTRHQEFRIRVTVFFNSDVFPHLVRLLQLGVAGNLVRTAHAAAEDVAFECRLAVAIDPAGETALGATVNKLTVFGRDFLGLASATVERARAEHVFGHMEDSMCGMRSRAVGLLRNVAQIIFTCLDYSMLKYEQIKRLGMN